MERILYELANLRDDGLPRFRQIWGKFFKRYKNSEILVRRDELRLLWAKRSSYLKGDFTEADWESSIANPITKRILDLHEECDLRYPEPLEQVVCEHWLRERGHRWIVKWGPREKRMCADPRCLPAVLALGCIHFADLLCVCRNPECPARFFVGNRSDRLYCSEECAKPAKRAAKLDWWHKNRGAKSAAANESRRKANGKISA